MAAGGLARFCNMAAGLKGVVPGGGTAGVKVLGRERLGIAAWGAPVVLVAAAGRMARLASAVRWSTLPAREEIKFVRVFTVSFQASFSPLKASLSSSSSAAILWLSSWSVWIAP
jgi:hypothetical protein